MDLSDIDAAELLELGVATAQALEAADGARRDRTALQWAESPYHDTFVIGMYMRARSLHDAIARHLLPARLSNEAMILGRPLFEESVRLGFVAELDDQRRAAHIVWWADDSYQRDIHELKAGEAILGEAGETIASLEKQRRQLAEYARARAISPRRMPDTKAAALKLGRRADFHAFVFSHQFVHGGHVSVVARRLTRRDGARLCQSRRWSWITPLCLDMGSAIGPSDVRRRGKNIRLGGFARDQRLARPV